MGEGLGNGIGNGITQSTERMEALAGQLQGYAVTYGMRVIAAILILTAGWLAARFVAGSIRKSLGASGRLDPMLVGFASRVVHVMILAFTLLAVLGKFGVETTSIVGVLAAASLAVGLALQGTLSNFAAGVMLLIFRPFNVGDTVNLGGRAGRVVEVGIFATELAPPSGEYVLIPNSDIWGSSIINNTRKGTRRVDIPVGISYDDDVDKATRILMEICAADERILEDPAPSVFLSDFGDNSIDLNLYYWTAASDWWASQNDVRRQIKRRFDEEGVTFPFPQRDVHLFPQPVPGASSSDSPS